jgi:aspartate aminotransferase
MPSLSEHSQHIHHSPIRKLARIAKQAEKEGKKVHYLNIGQPDFQTPQSIINSLRETQLSTIPYAPSEGILQTREAWSSYFSHNNIQYNPDEIIITSGASEAITMALSATCSSEEEVIVFQPCYANYLSFAAQSQVNLVPITLHLKNGFHIHSSEEIEEHITKRTRAILLSNPANPTGTVLTQEECDIIAAIAKKYNLFIISDEVYREFTFNKQKAISFALYEDISNNVILVDSVSKRFNACGLRMGCIASKNQELMNVILRFAQARLSVSTLEQYAIIDILKTTDNHIDDIVKIYKERRDLVFQMCSDIPNVEISQPEGAIYSFIKLPIDDAEDFAKWILTDFEYNNETLCISPAEGFYVTPYYGKKEIRIAHVENKEELTKALTILKKALEKYNMQI